MKKEDIEFLKELQHELLTQTNDGNADPVFWGVMETVEIPSPDSYDKAYLYNNDDCETSSLEWVNSIIEDEYNENMSKAWKLRYDAIDKKSPEDVAEFFNDYTDTDTYSVVYAAEHDQLSTHTGAFLTKRAAKQYIEKNYYNHCKPRTYAMTAIRNYEYENLLKILKTIDFDKDINETTDGQS